MIALAGLLGAAGSAAACSCARNPTAAGLLETSASVFTATVADDREVGRNVSVTTFRITEAFKGPPAGATIKVIHPSGSSASCGVQFTVGESYTISTHEAEPARHGADQATTLCSTWMFLPHVGVSEKLIQDMRALRPRQ